MIGLCSSKKAEVVAAAPAPNGWEECAACQWVAAELEQFVQNPRTEDEIISFVNGTVCKLVPAWCARTATSWSTRTARL